MEGHKNKKGARPMAVANARGYFNEPPTAQLEIKGCILTAQNEAKLSGRTRSKNQITIKQAAS